MKQIRTKGVYLFSKTPVCLSELIPKLPGKTLYDQVIGMVDQLNKKFVGKGAVDMYGIPMPFVHVPPGADALVFLTQQYRAIGITLEVHLEFWVVQSGDCEYLAGHLEDQRGLIKGEFFGHPCFGQAIHSEFFNIHNSIFYRIKQTRGPL